MTPKQTTTALIDQLLVEVEDGRSTLEGESGDPGGEFNTIFDSIERIAKQMKRNLKAPGKSKK